MDFLPLDLIHDKIGSYLLQDPNKTIHKIFHEKKDDNLQLLLFGEVKKLNFIDIDNIENEILYTNDKVKDCINIILKNNKCNDVCTKMTINFFECYSQIKIIICGYNSKDVKIATIDYCKEYNERIATIDYCKENKNNYKIKYLGRGFCLQKSHIENKNIIEEYKY